MHTFREGANNGGIQKWKIYQHQISISLKKNLRVAWGNWISFKYFKLISFIKITATDTAKHIHKLNGHCICKNNDYQVSLWAQLLLQIIINNDNNNQQANTFPQITISNTTTNTKTTNNYNYCNTFNNAKTTYKLTG